MKFRKQKSTLLSCHIRVYQNALLMKSKRFFMLLDSDIGMIFYRDIGFYLFWYVNHI
jgi:hypothetical protein